MESLAQRSLGLFGRAARLRCPNCGGSPLFSHWVRMRERCPVCRIRLERGEEGYQVGAYMFNIVAAELITLFLAFDLIFRPPTSEDFEER